MKAIVLTAYGDVNKLEFREVPELTVGPNEIKVRMVGASINPVDCKLRAGALHGMMPLTFPAILGKDASGEVVEIGAGVTRFNIGAHVMGLVNGAYAEFVVAPTEAWTEVPPKMDFVDASALPLVLLTGAQLIEDGVRPRKGDVVLVTGAAGSVGRAAAFVALAAGAEVWAGVRTEQKDEASKLGVHGVIALDVESEIAWLPLLDGIADTVGGPMLARLFNRVKPGGTIASVVGEPAGAKAHGFIVRALMTHPDSNRLSMLAQAVATGKLFIPITKRLPLSKAREAHLLADQHAGGKIILTGLPQLSRKVRTTPSPLGAAP
jgi:NADPH:quinone reductase-like Zn-dependent oxidoreductase